MSWSVSYLGTWSCWPNFVVLAGQAEGERVMDRKRQREGREKALDRESMKERKSKSVFVVE